MRCPPIHRRRFGKQMERDTMEKTNIRPGAGAIRAMNSLARPVNRTHEGSRGEKGFFQTPRESSEDKKRHRGAHTIWRLRGRRAQTSNFTHHACIVGIFAGHGYSVRWQDLSSLRDQVNIPNVECGFARVKAWAREHENVRKSPGAPGRTRRR